MRVVPRSLFGRLLLVVLTVLVIAQLSSLALHMHERGELLLQATGMRAAQRVADIVTLFDTVSVNDRERIAKVLSTPPLSVRVSQRAVIERDEAGHGARSALFATLVRRFVGEDRMLRARVSEVPALARAPGPMGRGMGMGPGHMRDGPHHPPGMGYVNRPGVAFIAQVQLADGAWVSVESRQPEQTANWPYRLLSTIAILLVAAVLIAFIAVRWVTRPLQVLAAAAMGLGRNVNRPPLPETGPIEVARAAHAFNTMQIQLSDYLRSRTRLLAAMSHDLKTPITRLRLRSELLEDPKLRERYSQDLQELEAMVVSTLDFMRGIDDEEPAQAFDVMAMLEALQSDLEETGAKVTLSGHTGRSYVGQRQALRRCLGNLLDNAIKYGGSADVAVSDRGDDLLIQVRDQGSRETGGTGLGLAIARQIARAHGGDVKLLNRPSGGLEARLVLPRGRAPAATRAPSSPAP
jgi:signal transduction histidine kinase